ncbi:MAG TPA: glycosyltransferase family 2 protein [Methanospirillum sp.]|uniref:glycosyltransferase family 2 protein n=1 Tax=Methanospirillum sp. TaxID=45200 RepID=UPI002B7BACB6|nr:glycosyltransferase family 2 protein [Methanospirillum sp.]HWQ64506.1 glycosyltransferase family 2 protein [Methanospirillum sp.]
MNPVVSIVIPALNEEKTIGACIKKIHEGCESAGISYEIIVADSSTDQTPIIASKMGARVIHPDKRGYGNAYLSGFAHATGDIIVIGDADNTYDFRIIPELIRPIRQENVDMVIGSRMAGTILPGAMPALHQYLGNPLLTRLLNFAFGTSFSDCHSGFRAFRKEILERLSLHTGGMEFASEMMIEAAKNNIKVAEIPITYYPRESPSNLHSFADGWRHVRFIMLEKPLPFLAVPGGLFALFGLVMMGFVLLNTHGSGFHSFILGVVFLTGGFQLVMMGIALKAYAVTNGFDVCGRWFRPMLRYRTLEYLLFGGGILIVLGLVNGVSILYDWVHRSFGELSQVMSALLILCSIILGLQMVFTAILVSMMLLRCDRDGCDFSP